jgi:glucokinase
VTTEKPALPILVVEVGGTFLGAAFFDPARRVLERRRTAPTPNYLDGERAGLQRAVLDAIRTLAAQVLDGDEPAIVAVAYPGPLDEAGRVLATPTVLGSSAGEPFLLQQACEDLWPGATVHTMNDLTAAGYRYVAAGLRHFAVVTVGSGIGHKVFLDGRPRVGPGGRGGEIGHLRLDFSADAPPCDCGGRGHLGGLASGRGTVAGVRRRAASDPEGYAGSSLARHVDDPRRIDGPAVAAAYRADDAFTVAAVRDAARYLGQGLAAIHLDTGIERIILVGGFAIALGERYRRLVAAASADACWQIGQDWDAIVRLGELGDYPALLGGGFFASGLVGR